MTTDAAVFDGFPLVGLTPGGGRAKVTTLDGWLSRSLRRQRDSRSQQDGDWPSMGHAQGRDVTVGGQIVYSSVYDATLERRQMLALGGAGLSELIVQDALGSLSAMVEIDSLVLSPVRDAMVSFTFGLHSPDPLLYGPPTFASTTLASTAAGTGLTYPLAYPLDYGVPAGVTPGALTLPNAGTAAYWPVLRIDGPVPSPAVTLVETGDTIRVGVDVAAGQWLDIDCANRRILLNGVLSVRTHVTYSGSWLAVPVGGGSLTWTADAADPAAMLSAWGHESAWL